ncbi:uncharacterized protein PHALS_06865 [Plasmopara halstedii]|uniref:Uncharacterized protein n=1 Tax=Plasmopara halstedii TaxID=4781 RepID=A0A0P1B465_PLAHL|nr:uncharacterized protein PHALS_06865 [Plasmopara halstedii]CEG49079.1 hypothetical protein PHALS_06865 [Plasmopara halstedii]|eukprot:XP_024585448.1 hypothetical protein PHALS_06865 [Plasmopara halstedii]
MAQLLIISLKNVNGLLQLQLGHSTSSVKLSLYDCAFLNDDANGRSCLSLAK